MLTVKLLSKPRVIEKFDFKIWLIKAKKNEP